MIVWTEVAFVHSFVATLSNKRREHGDGVLLTLVWRAVHGHGLNVLLWLCFSLQHPLVIYYFHLPTFLRYICSYRIAYLVLMWTIEIVVILEQIIVGLLILWLRFYLKLRHIGLFLLLSNKALPEQRELWTPRKKWQATLIACIWLMSRVFIWHWWLVFQLQMWSCVHPGELLVIVLLRAEWNSVFVVEFISCHRPSKRLGCIKIDVDITEVPTLCDEGDGLFLDEVEKFRIWVQTLETKLCKNMQMVVELYWRLVLIWFNEALLDTKPSIFFFWANEHVDIVSWVEANKRERYWVAFIGSPILHSCLEVSFD